MTRQFKDGFLQKRCCFIDHLAGNTEGEEQFEAAWRCGRSLALLGRYDDALDAFAFAQHALRGMHPSDTRPVDGKGRRPQARGGG